MFIVESDFICIFKIGDNINYNLRVLKLLYNIESQEDAKKILLYKPIIITIASICEAVLYDFHVRIRSNTVEGVQNIAQEVISRIRGKKIDEFGKYIASAKKNDFFDSSHSSLYDELDKLRKLRNRIHIQNTKNYFEPDEWKAFNVDRKIMAEKVLERILKHMHEKYKRPASVTGYVDDFELPWEEHFPVI